MTTAVFRPDMLGPEGKKNRFSFWDFARVLAAADLTTLKKAPRTEQNWYGFLGYSLLMISILQGAGMGFTASQIYHSVQVGIGVGCVWAGLMMGFNYGVCWTMDNLHGGSWLRKTVVILIVLSLNCAVAALNAKFAQMQIMDKEITATLKFNEQTRRHAIDVPYDAARRKHDVAVGKLKEDAATTKKEAMTNFESGAWRTKAQGDLDAKRKDLKVKEDRYICEIDGTCGTKIPGDGALAKAKKAIIDNLKADILKDEAALQTETARRLPLVQPTLDDIEVHLQKDLREGPQEAEFEVAKERYQREIAEFEANPHDGFVDRDLALAAQWVRDPVTMLLIQVIFFTIEAFIIGFKLLSRRTTYIAMMQRESQERITEQDDARIEQLKASRGKWEADQQASRETQEREYRANLAAQTNYLEEWHRHEENVRVKLQALRDSGAEGHTIEAIRETLEMNRPRLRLIQDSKVAV